MATYLVCKTFTNDDTISWAGEDYTLGTDAFNDIVTAELVASQDSSDPVNEIIVFAGNYTSSLNSFQNYEGITLNVTGVKYHEDDADMATVTLKTFKNNGIATFANAAFEATSVINNAGKTITLDGATFTADTVTNDGTFTIKGGATVNSTFTSTSSEKPGTIRLAGTINSNSEILGDNTISIASATTLDGATVVGGILDVKNHLTLKAATLTAGTANITSGKYIIVDAGTSIINLGKVNFTGSTGITMKEGAILTKSNIAGTVSVHTSATGDGATITGENTIETILVPNKATAVKLNLLDADLTSDITVNGNGIVNALGENVVTGDITNNGVINVADGNSLGLNDGSLANAGTINLTGSITTTTTAQIANSGNIIVTGTGLAAAVVMGDNGKVVFGTVDAAAETTFTGSITDIYNNPNPATYGKSTVQVLNGEVEFAKGSVVDIQGDAADNRFTVGFRDAAIDPATVAATATVKGKVASHNGTWIGAAGAYDESFFDKNFVLIVDGGSYTNDANAFTVRGSGEVIVRNEGSLSITDAAIRGDITVTDSSMTFGSGNLYAEEGYTATIAITDSALTVNNNFQIGNLSNADRKGALVLDNATVDGTGKLNVTFAGSVSAVDTNIDVAEVANAGSFTVSGDSSISIGKLSGTIILDTASLTDSAITTPYDINNKGAIKNLSGTSTITDSTITVGGFLVGSYDEVKDAATIGNATTTLAGTTLNVFAKTYGADDLGGLFVGDGTYEGETTDKKLALEITKGSQVTANLTTVYDGGSLLVTGEGSKLDSNETNFNSTVTITDKAEVDVQIVNIWANTEVSGDAKLSTKLWNNEQRNIRVRAGGVLTVDAATVELDTANQSNGGQTWLRVYEDGALVLQNGATLTMGHLTDDTGWSKDVTTRYVQVYDGGSITVTGSTFDAANEELKLEGSFAVSGTSTIKVGKITGSKTIEVADGSTIKDSTVGGATSISLLGKATFTGANTISGLAPEYYDAEIVVDSSKDKNSLTVTANRMTLGYGLQFNVTGGIADALAVEDKTQEFVTLDYQAGFSITGGGDHVSNLNVTNAYAKIGNTSSKNSAANSTYNLNFVNSIVDFTNQLQFTAPSSESLKPVMTTTIDASAVTISGHLKNNVADSKITVKNGSILTVNGSFQQLGGTLEVLEGSTFDGKGYNNSSHGGQTGTITVDGAGATFNLKTAQNDQWQNSGTVSVLNGAKMDVTYTTNAGTITIDTDSLLTGTALTNTVDAEGKQIGTITIDATKLAADSYVKVIDLTQGSALTGVSVVGNSNARAIYGADGDVVVTNITANKLYVNSAWTGINPDTGKAYEFGDQIVIAEGTTVYYGINAFDTLASASDVAVPGEETEITIAGTLSSGATFGNGQNVEISGTALIDWNAFFFVGRGRKQDDPTVVTTVTFKNANITSTKGTPSGIFSTGFNVSGYNKTSTSKGYGVLKITDSSLVCDYVLDRNLIDISNSNVTFGNMWVHGMIPAETGTEDYSTATLNISNDSKFTLVTINGMPLGSHANNNEDGYGVININDSTFDIADTSAWTISELGTLNLNGNAEFTAEGAVVNAGAINMEVLPKEEAEVLTETESTETEEEVAFNKFTAKSISNSGTIDAKTGSTITTTGLFTNDNEVVLVGTALTTNGIVNNASFKATDSVIDGGGQAGSPHITNGLGGTMELTNSIITTGAFIINSYGTSISLDNSTLDARIINSKEITAVDSTIISTDLRNEGGKFVVSGDSTLNVKLTNGTIDLENATLTDTTVTGEGNLSIAAQYVKTPAVPAQGVEGEEGYVAGSDAVLGDNIVTFNGANTVNAITNVGTLKIQTIPAVEAQGEEGEEGYVAGSDAVAGALTAGAITNFITVGEGADAVTTSGTITIDAMSTLTATSIAGGTIELTNFADNATRPVITVNGASAKDFTATVQWKYANPETGVEKTYTLDGTTTYTDDNKFLVQKTYSKGKTTISVVNVSEGKDKFVVSKKWDGLLDGTVVEGYDGKEYVVGFNAFNNLFNALENRGATTSTIVVMDSNTYYHSDADLEFYLTHGLEVITVGDANVVQTVDLKAGKDFVWATTEDYSAKDKKFTVTLGKGVTLKTTSINPDTGETVVDAGGVIYNGFYYIPNFDIYGTLDANSTLWIGSAGIKSVSESTTFNVYSTGRLKGQQFCIHDMANITVNGFAVDPENPDAEPVRLTETQVAMSYTTIYSGTITLNNTTMTNVNWTSINNAYGSYIQQKRTWNGSFLVLDNSALTSGSYLLVNGVNSTYPDYLGKAGLTLKNGSILKGNGTGTDGGNNTVTGSQSFIELSGDSTLDLVKNLTVTDGSVTSEASTIIIGGTLTNNNGTITLTATPAVGTEGEEGYKPAVASQLTATGIITNNGEFSATGSTILAKATGFGFVNNETLTIDSSTVTVGGGAAILKNEGSGAKQITIKNDSTVNAGLYNYTGATVTITDSTVGTAGAYVKNWGTIDATDAVLKASSVENYGTYTVGGESSFAIANLSVGSITLADDAEISASTITESAEGTSVKVLADTEATFVGTNIINALIDNAGTLNIAAEQTRHIIDAENYLDADAILNNGSIFGAEGVFVYANTITNNADGEIVADSLAAGTITNYGSFTVTGLTAGTITNNADGEIVADSISADEIVNSGDIAVDAIVKAEGAEVAGAITNNADGEILAGSIAAATITNYGDIDADSVSATGTIKNAGTFTVGTINEALNEEAPLSDTEITETEADEEIAAIFTADRVENSAGELTVNGKAVIDHNVVVSGGKVTFNGDVTAANLNTQNASATININNATVSVAGTIYYSGTIVATNSVLDGSKFSGTGTMKVVNSSINGITLNHGTMQLDDMSLANVTIDGAFDVVGGSDFSGVNEVEGLTVSEGATLTISAAATIAAKDTPSLTVTGDIVNNGTITINADGLSWGSSWNSLKVVAGAVTNSGTIIVEKAENTMAIVQDDGIYLYKVEGEFTTDTLCVNAAWTGKAVGDKVTYGEKEYVFGMNAFATVGSIVFYADTTNLVIAAGDYDDDLVWTKDGTTLTLADGVELADVDLGAATITGDITADDVTFTGAATLTGDISADDLTFTGDTTVSGAITADVLNVNETLAMDWTKPVDVNTLTAGANSITIGLDNLQNVLSDTAVITADEGADFASIVTNYEANKDIFAINEAGTTLSLNAAAIGKVSTTLEGYGVFGTIASAVADDATKRVLIVDGDYAENVYLNGKRTQVLEGAGSIGSGKYFFAGGYNITKLGWTDNDFIDNFKAVGTKKDPKNTNVTIDGGKFTTAYVVGADLILIGSGDPSDVTFYRFGNVNMTINGGEFKTTAERAITGGVFYNITSNKQFGTAKITGDINLTIAGGEFAGYNVYGGNYANGSKFLGGRTSIVGDVTLTLDATTNELNFAANEKGFGGIVQAGSFGPSYITGNTEVILKGAEGITFEQLIGGSTSDEHKIENGKWVNESYVTGTRTLTFSGFTGNLDFARVQDFNTVAFKGANEVNFTGGFHKNFNGDVTNWVFEEGASLGGTVNFDFTGDSVDVLGSLELYKSNVTGFDIANVTYDTTKLAFEETETSYLFTTIA